MGYVRTAGMSTAARRARRRAALVITGLLLALLVVFGLSMAFVQGWIGTPGGGGDQAADTATVSAPPPGVTAAEVSVNVYNAGGIPGAAGRAGEALRARSFSVATVANDPLGADVPGYAVIRHGPEGVEEAELLKELLPQDVELVDDGREAATVDLVLGAEWEDLPSADEAAAPSEEG